MRDEVGAPGRHTYVTLAIDEGVDPKKISDRVGHSSSDITLRVYTHPTLVHDREVADLMGEVIRRATKDPEQPNELAG